MKLTLPAGYELPDNVKPGDRFDAVATLVAGENGEATLVALDGAPLSEAEPDESPKAAPAAEPDDFVGAVMSAY